MKTIDRYEYNHFLTNAMLANKTNDILTELDVLHENYAKTLFAVLWWNTVFEVDHGNQKVTINGSETKDFSFTPRWSHQNYDRNLYYQFLKAIKESKVLNYNVFTKLD